MAITKEQNTDQLHQAIDLGLPSGTLWASCNIGAEEPESFASEYYAWGEIDEFKSGSNNSVFLGNISGTDYDVAHVKWGGDWKMPTLEQFQELLNCCKSEWIKDKKGSLKVRGRKFTGPNGNCIFLSANGYENSVDRYGLTEIGAYWTGTNRVYLMLNDNNAFFPNFPMDRDDRLTIRPVMMLDK